MKLLDTNAVIALLNGNAAARSRFNATVARQTPLAISTIVLYELRFGIAKSTRRRENAEHLAAFLTGPVLVLGFEDDDATRAGEIRFALERAGTPIGPYDVLIAGQALRHGAELVTANRKEFARVSGLKVENWTEAR